MSKFKIPPISTLIGTNIFNFLRVTLNNKISPRYYLNVFISFLIVHAFTSFGPAVKKVINPRRL